MVYVFGDLRQLRKFELSRPPISRPQPLANPRHRPPISSPFAVASRPVIQPIILPISQPRISPLPQAPDLAIPSAAVVHDSRRARTISASSMSSGYSIVSSSGSSSYNSEEQHDATLIIEISPAYFDDINIEGPATGSVNPAAQYYSFPSPTNARDAKGNLSVEEFTPTASFIHPYDPLCDEDFDATREMSPEERQGMGPFDFDLLPRRDYTFPESSRALSAVIDDAPTPSMVEKEGGAAAAVLAGLRRPRDIISRAQSRCNHNEPGTVVTEPEKRFSRSLTPHVSPARSSSPVDPAAQFKRIKSVPAFASPFTRVLNPVVTRAQWEIVVRSALLAGVLCWGFIGALLAVPVRR